MGRVFDSCEPLVGPASGPVSIYQTVSLGTWVNKGKE